MTHTDSTAGVDSILHQWNPSTGLNPSVARAQTRRAVNWLQTDGGRRTRSEFITALAGDTTLNNQEWWARAVHPGLQQFRDADLIEYRPPTADYYWIGNADS